CQQWVGAVGGVLRVLDVVTRDAPHAAYEDEGEVGVGMAEIGGVVGGDAADVHPRGRPGIGLPDLTGSGVVEPQRDALAGEPGNVGGGPRFHVFEPIRADQLVMSVNSYVAPSGASVTRVTLRVAKKIGR